MSNTVALLIWAAMFADCVRESLLKDRAWRAAREEAGQ